MSTSYKTSERKEAKPAIAQGVDEEVQGCVQLSLSCSVHQDSESFLLQD